LNSDLSLESYTFDARKRCKGTKSEILFITLLEAVKKEKSLTPGASPKEGGSEGHVKKKDVPEHILFSVLIQSFLVSKY